MPVLDGFGVVNFEPIRILVEKSRPLLTRPSNGKKEVSPHIAEEFSLRQMIGNG